MAKKLTLTELKIKSKKIELDRDRQRTAKGGRYPEDWEVFARPTIRGPFTGHKSQSPTGDSVVGRLR